MYSYEKYVKLCHELRQKKPTPVAEEAGVHKSLISRWKSGGGITDSSAFRLAECLGVDVSELTEESSVFYDKFVELCAKKQISPCAAAEEMGYQRSVVTRWSKGTAPRDATIQRVANYFGVSASFLKGEEQKENPTSPKADEVDEVTMELLDIIQNGTDVDRQDMLDMLRIFSKRRETR